MCIRDSSNTVASVVRRVVQTYGYLQGVITENLMTARIESFARLTLIGRCKPPGAILGPPNQVRAVHSLEINQHGEPFLQSGCDGMQSMIALRSTRYRGLRWPGDRKARAPSHESVALFCCQL